MSRLSYPILFLALPVALVTAAAPPASSPAPAEQAKRLKERDEQVRQATLLRGQGKYREALVAAGKAVELTRALRGPHHEEVAKNLASLAESRALAGDLEGAVKHRQGVLAVWEKVAGEKHWRTVTARLELRIARKVAALSKAERDEMIAALRQEEDTVRLYGQGKLALVQRALQEALRVQRKYLGEEAHPVAGSLRRLGLVRSAQNDFRGADQAYREALAIYRKALPKNHPDIASALYNLAGLQANLRNYAAARKSYEEALAIQRQALPKHHPHIANSLHGLGNVQGDLGDYEAARKSQEEALAIRRQALPKLHPLIATSLHNLGHAQSDLGDNEAARKRHAEGLAIFRKALPKFHPHIVMSLNNLGIAQTALRDYKAAHKSFEEALAIRRQALPKGHPLIARSLNALANAQHYLRDYEAARKSHEETLAIRRQALPKNHPDLADTLHNLGVAQYNLRDYGAARISYEEVLAIRRATLPKDHPDIASSLHGLGLAQGDLHDYEAARKSHAEALAIRRQVLPKNHPDIAKSLNYLESAQGQLRDNEAARKMHAEALAIQRKALPRFHPDIAQSLTNLGVAQGELGDYAAARKSLEEDLAIRRKALPKDHPDIATSLGNLGIVQRNLRDYEAARKSHEEVVAILRKVLPKDHPNIAATLKNLGAVALETGKGRAEAIAHLREAIGIYSGDQSRLALAQAEAEQLLSSTNSRHTLDVLLSLLERPTPGQTEEVYALVVGIKGAVTARQRWARLFRDSSDRATADLLGQLRQANLLLLRSALDGPARPEANASLAPDELRALGVRRARLEQKLATRSERYRAMLKEARRGSTEVRAALPADCVLIDCLEYAHISVEKGNLMLQRRVVAFVVRPGQKSAVLVPLGPAERLEELIESWRASHGRGKKPAAGRPDPAVALRKELWLRLAKHVKGAKVVLLSPDGALNGLPWAALPGAKAGQFLVHEHAFAIVPVPQLLPELLAPRPRPKDEQPTLLLAGAIAFGAAKAGAKGKEGLPVFAELPGTESELNDLKVRFQKAFRGAPAAKVLREEEATKAAFLAEAPRARFLHLATHGFFAAPSEHSALSARARAGTGREVRLRWAVTGKLPGLLSGVVFAGVNDPKERVKAVLTALEASDLELRKAELVTLSACETGRGQVAGGEGVLGLQRAFQVAGARSVVASLWKVPDEETHQLMRELYRRLWAKEPLARAEVLRQAQLWMLANWKPRGGLELDKGKPGAVPPYVWAAFVLSGDWR